jgi:hypothetical protein
MNSLPLDKLTIALEYIEDDGDWVSQVLEMPSSYAKGATPELAASNALDIMRDRLSVFRDNPSGERAVVLRIFWNGQRVCDKLFENDERAVREGREFARTHYKKGNPAYACARLRSYSPNGYSEYWMSAHGPLFDSLDDLKEKLGKKRNDS